MFIYTNKNDEIKFIEENNILIPESNDSNELTKLNKYEIDRHSIFGDMSNFRILNYYYKITSSGRYEITPTIDSDILLIYEQQNKLDILKSEKDKLLQITKEQDKLLVDNTYKISMLEMNLGGM